MLKQDSVMLLEGLIPGCLDSSLVMDSQMYKWVMLYEYEGGGIANLAHFRPFWVQ